MNKWVGGYGGSFLSHLSVGFYRGGSVAIAAVLGFENLCSGAHGVLAAAVQQVRNLPVSALSGLRFGFAKVGDLNLERSLCVCAVELRLKR